VTDDMQAVFQVFLAESEEGLVAMESGLMALEARPDDNETLFHVFRAAHTLKGNAAALGLNALASFAHTMEDVLDRLRSGDVVLNPDRTTLLLQSVDALRHLLSEAAGGADQLGPDQAALLDRLKAETASPRGATSTMEPSIGSREQAAHHDRPTQSPAPRRPSLRVDVERLDQLLGLVGEIAVARDHVTQLLHDPATARKSILDAQREADRLHLDLHELVLSLRMVPVGPTFQQLARLVRDVALSLGKEARLTIEGEEAEVDNSVLQLLKDPLAHMVRNALDHGIEPPEARLAAGKDRCGQIRLRAAHERGALVIELTDDGGGLDRERVLGRARGRGLIGAEAEVDDARLHDLVFQPGFSTAERVTGVSGRGVGLDVVRRNIGALRGSVDLSSVPGRGSRFTIRLPLTLAIIDGLVVKVASESYIVPLETVIESAALPQAEANRGFSRGVLNLHGTSLPYVRLRHRFDLQSGHARKEIAIIVRSEIGPAGLVVDAVLGQSQIVIKPLPKVLDRLQGVVAAAVLGDGSVALILDPARLVQKEAPVAHLAQASA